MKERKVILTWEAIYDIVDITDYITADFGWKRADRFQDEIYEKIYDLSETAGSFRKSDIVYRGFQIYFRLFAPSIIFYTIKEPEEEVHILRVLRSERNTLLCYEAGFYLKEKNAYALTSLWYFTANNGCISDEGRIFLIILS